MIVHERKEGKASYIYSVYTYLHVHVARHPMCLKRRHWNCLGRDSNPQPPGF